MNKQSTAQAQKELYNSKGDLQKLKRTIASPEKEYKENKYPVKASSSSVYSIFFFIRVLLLVHHHLVLLAPLHRWTVSHIRRLPYQICHAMYGTVPIRAISAEGLEVAPSLFILERAKKLKGLIDKHPIEETLIQLQGFQEKIYFEFSHMRNDDMPTRLFS